MISQACEVKVAFNFRVALSRDDILGGIRDS